MSRLTAVQAVTLRQVARYTELTPLGLQSLLSKQGAQISRATAVSRLTTYARQGLLKRARYGRYRLTPQGRVALGRHEARLAARRVERAQVLGGAA